jgi:hypothetical protein
MQHSTKAAWRLAGALEAGQQAAGSLVASLHCCAKVGPCCGLACRQCRSLSKSVTVFNRQQLSQGLPLPPLLLLAAERLVRHAGAEQAGLLLGRWCCCWQQ